MLRFQRCAELLLLVLAGAPVALIGQVRMKDSCLFAGVGTWVPAYEGDMWPGVRSIVLNSEVVPLPHAVSRSSYKKVTTRPASAPSGQGRTAKADRGWLWTVPIADSLLLVRVAALSEGTRLSGVWVGDTLKGRVVTFSDLVNPHPPRGNAYAVRFECNNPKAALNALLAVNRLRAFDIPNTTLNSYEDSLQAWHLR